MESLGRPLRLRMTSTKPLPSKREEVRVVVPREEGREGGSPGLSRGEEGKGRAGRLPEGRRKREENEARGEGACFVMGDWDDDEDPATLPVLSGGSPTWLSPLPPMPPPSFPPSAPASSISSTGSDGLDAGPGGAEGILGFFSKFRILMRRS
jgi:hypothetical protein